MGLTFDKLLIILAIAAMLIGPERLPGYTRKLAEWVRKLRGMADTAKDRMKEEMGEDFTEEDWRQLDPRQYDPRRIVRDALRDAQAPAVKPVTAAGPAAYQPRKPPQPLEGEPVPFDTEAT